jgi:hypothetical protein
VGWGICGGPFTSGTLEVNEPPCNYPKKLEDSNILFLSKTKLEKKEIDVFWRKLGLTNMLCQPRDGRSGGITMFWRNGVEVSLNSLSKYFIDADVGSGTERWRFTGIYGESRSDKKVITWRALCMLKHNRGPWFCMRDFNEILFQHEKEGGVPRP